MPRIILPVAVLVVLVTILGANCGYKQKLADTVLTKGGDKGFELRVGRPRDRIPLPAKVLSLNCFILS